MDEGLAARASRFREADSSERRSIADAIVESSAGTLELARVDDHVAVFLHRPSSILFNLVSGGTAQIGFATSERDRLREQYQYWDECDEVELALSRVQIGCVRAVRIEPFLLASRPLSADQLGVLVRDEAPVESNEGRVLPDLKKIAKLPADKYVEFLESFSAGTFDTAQIPTIENALHRVGLRFPSDAEREHAARAGTENLFPHGNEIPDSPNIGESVFGFLDLGADAEVCADGWVETIDGIPEDGRPRPPADVRVARGGAASIYPWQNCAEWTLLLCASRTPTNNFLVARPALSL